MEGLPCAGVSVTARAGRLKNAGWQDLQGQTKKPVGRRPGIRVPPEAIGGDLHVRTGIGTGDYEDLEAARFPGLPRRRRGAWMARMDAPQNTVTPPSMQPPQKKKGIPVLGWVGIGCGSILVILAVVMGLLVGKCKRWAEEVQKNPEKAAAEMVMRFNPEFDLVSQDEAAGTMTIRNKKSGEQVTLGYKDIAEGRFSVTDAAGNTTTVGAGNLDQVPAWVPRPPDADSVTSGFHQESDGKVTGMINVKTKATADEVAAFYEEAAKAAGFGSSSKNSASVGGTETRTLEFSGNDRTLNVSISSSPQGMTVAVVYEGTK